jgi:TPR repeat protein
MYASGQGVPVDLDEAERHWRAAATAGQVQALVDLGQLFDYHRSDPVEATYWYLLAAKEGVDVEGALRGLWHRLQPLADAGHTRARTLCGVVLAFQLGDPAGGVALLTASADDGDAIAQRTLAFLLQHGTGTEPDLDLAVTLFRAAAEAGDLLAAYNLGVLYRSGEGVPIEPTESVRWLRVAAAGGLIEAYPLLGDQLAAVDLDQEALEWYLRGAREGDAGCMFAAASCYRDGIGTDLDLVQSLRWFLAMLNAKKGDGLHEAHKIAPRMSTEEIVEAGRLAGRTLETKTLLDMRG